VPAAALVFELGLAHGPGVPPNHPGASASAGVWEVRRIVSAVVPIALLPLLENHGASGMLAAIIGALLASLALILAAAPPGHARKPVG
jgi:putative MFS transporter